MRAERELQAMVDRSPNLAAYARVSYVRELRGDLPGAASAMRLAVAAGGPAPENNAYVSALLGELERRRGRGPRARRAFAQALALVPGHAAAELGLARLDARHGSGWRRMRSTRLPSPSTSSPSARRSWPPAETPAQRTFALVTAERRLLDAAGSTSDVELAVFEADHGDPEQAVALARRGYAAAPSARAADALGWALTRAGEADEGLR